MQKIIITHPLTVKETVERLKCSRAWLYQQLRRDATMPRPFKRGRRTLFVEEEIESYLQAQINSSRIAVPSK